MFADSLAADVNVVDAPATVTANDELPGPGETVGADVFSELGASGEGFVSRRIAS